MVGGGIISGNVRETCQMVFTANDWCVIPLDETPTRASRSFDG